MKWDQYITVFVFVGVIASIGYLNLMQKDINYRDTKPYIAIRKGKFEVPDSMQPPYSKFRLIFEDLKLSRDLTNEMYENHFSLESDFFGIFQYFESNLYATNPIPNKVIEGDDGYLFLGDRFSNAFSESKGFDNFKRGHLKLIKNQFCSKDWWLATKNISYYVAVAPNKLTIYDSKISIRKSTNKTKRQQTVDFFNDLDAPIIDLTESILPKKEEELYYKNDSHWNELGAYYAYVQLMNVIQEDYPEIKILSPSEFNIEEKNETPHDLTRMLQTQRTEVSPKLVLIDPKGTQVESQLCIPDYYMQGVNAYESRFKSDVNSLKVLLLGDSFGMHWRNFLKESFGEVIFVRHNRFDPDLILSVQPDIVINEFVERNIEGLMIRPSRPLEEHIPNSSGE